MWAYGSSIGTIICISDLFFSHDTIKRYRVQFIQKNLHKMFVASLKVGGFDLAALCVALVRKPNTKLSRLIVTLQRWRGSVYPSFHRLRLKDFNNQWFTRLLGPYSRYRSFMPFLRFPSSRVLQRFHMWKLATKVGMYLPRLNYTEAKYPHITMKLWNIYEDGYNGKGFGCWKVLGCEWLVQLVIASCASSCWRPWSPYYRPLGGIFFCCWLVKHEVHGRLRWRNIFEKKSKGDFMKSIS